MITWTSMDPLVGTEVAKGPVAPEAVVPIFRRYPWASELARMERAEEAEIQCSPTITFRKDDGRELGISLVELQPAECFMVFFKDGADGEVVESDDETMTTVASLLEEFIAGRYEHLLGAGVSLNRTAARPAAPISVRRRRLLVAAISLSLLAAALFAASVVAEVRSGSVRGLPRLLFNLAFVPAGLAAASWCGWRSLRPGSFGSNHPQPQEPPEDGSEGLNSRGNLRSPRDFS